MTSVWVNTHELVLVGGNSSERGFSEDERLELGPVNVLQPSNGPVRASTADHVNTRLVLVHRVQYDLHSARDHSHLYCFR